MKILGLLVITHLLMPSFALGKGCLISPNERHSPETIIESINDVYGEGFSNKIGMTVDHVIESGIVALEVCELKVGTINGRDLISRPVLIKTSTGNVQLLEDFELFYSQDRK